VTADEREVVETLTCDVVWPSDATRVVSAPWHCFPSEPQWPEEAESAGSHPGRTSVLGLLSGAGDWVT
jgi:hypothetical protein